MLFFLMMPQVDKTRAEKLSLAKEKTDLKKQVGDPLVCGVWILEFWGM